MNKTSFRILIVCNIILVLFCSALLVKLYSINTESNTVISPSAVEEQPAKIIAENFQSNEKQNLESVDVQVNASETIIPNQPLPKGPLNISDVLTEEDMAEIARHRKDVQVTFFEPPKEDIEAHQRMLNIEQGLKQAEQ